MESILHISATPHVRDNASVRRIMLDVILALLPAAAWGVYRFGMHALFIILSCVAFSVLTEGLYQKLMGKEVTVSDCSAALTGLLIALNMPPKIPVLIPLLGCAFAILMVKQLFGGLGHNFMNPALAARCFLLISFAGHMTHFPIDGVSSATPLTLLKEGGAVTDISVMDMFLGNVGGVIGETSALALLIGALYLLVRKVISPAIPLAFIASFSVFVTLFGGHLSDPDLLSFVLTHIFGGGLMLGAWFMATDYATGPLTAKGRILYGIFIGILSGLFRIAGMSGKGISYAIIIGNLITPLIDKYMRPHAFGVVHEKTKKEEKTVLAEKKHEKYRAPRSEKLGALLALCAITLAAGIVLGFVYRQTKDTISQRAEEDTNAAYFKVCSAAAEFEDTDGDFDRLTDASDGTYTGILVNRVLKAKDAAGKTVGTIVDITTEEGYGGDIRLVVGVDTDNKVTGTEILEISETAGLGMNAERDLVPQYPGKSGNLKIRKDGGEIEAISGATITSRAVTKAVSAALYIAEVQA